MSAEGGILSNVLGLIYLVIKTTIFYFISLWLRNTLPRVRIDQLMNFNWKFLVPISVANLVITSLLLKISQVAGFAVDLTTNASFTAALPMTLLLLGGNIALILGVIAIYGFNIRRDRVQEEAQAEAIAHAPSH